MAVELSVDTSFLIDLERERMREQDDGPAHSFLRKRSSNDLHISAIALGEFAEGFDDLEHPVLWTVAKGVSVMAVDSDTALIYARVTRSLRGRGELIGSNDLWIGCSSLRHRMPLVTSNVKHFSRIDDLEVIDYRVGGDVN